MMDSNDMSARLQQIRVSRRSRILERVIILQAAADAIRAGNLDEEMKKEALMEAHRLKGLLGSLGFQEGSDAARKFEQLLANSGSAPELEALVAVIQTV